ncbi:MAG TPA: IS200/IS605 family transposase [Saprospiraceae bacterium]|nr:IS200/IS605 family transposase [Saprospiraceae bacterium]
MANTYTQIHLHVIFAVQNRNALIQDSWEEKLYKYITGIVQQYGHKMLQINGMPDHVHLLIGMRPTQSLSDLMKQVKGSSTEWINENKWTRHKFSWQAGYGAFSYAKSEVPRVIKYIQNQKEHHRTKTFTEEYMEFLEAFEVDFDERYIFKPPI